MEFSSLVAGLQELLWACDPPMPLKVRGLYLHKAVSATRECAKDPAFIQWMDTMSTNSPEHVGENLNVKRTYHPVLTSTTTHQWVTTGFKLRI